jgi:hypothetical protein
VNMRTAKVYPARLPEAELGMTPNFVYFESL